MDGNIHSFVIRVKFLGTSLGLSDGYAAGSWYPASSSFDFKSAKCEFRTVTDHMLRFSSITKTLVSWGPFLWRATPPLLITFLSVSEREEPWAPANFSLWPKEFTPPVQFSKNLFFIKIHVFTVATVLRAMTNITKLEIMSTQK